MVGGAPTHSRDKKKSYKNTIITKAEPYGNYTIRLSIASSKDTRFFDQVLIPTKLSLAFLKGRT